MRKDKGKLPQNQTLSPRQGSKSISSIVRMLNKRHAVVTVGGRCCLLNEIFDPVTNQHDITLSTVKDFQLQYANQRIGKRSLADIWLRHKDRRQFKGIIFSPKKNVPCFFNLWQGFAVKPMPGDCSLYLNHVRDNVAQGNALVYKFIIAWMADAVQNPSKRPGVAIVIRGPEGTGKGVFCTQFGKIFGKHFMQMANGRLLVGNFNSHLKDVLVAYADEAFYAGDKRHEGILKALITEDKLAIEFKGKDVIFLKNYMRLMVTSNNDWVVPAGLEARRFFILDIGRGKIQDRAYFGKMVNQMESGGRAALLHYLLHIDLTQIDLTKFPRTEALKETKVFSMSPVQKFWYARLCAGSLNLSDYPNKWPEFVSKSQLYDAYIEESDRTKLNRRSTETEFGIALKNWSRT